MNKQSSFMLTLKRKPSSQFGFDLRETKVAKIQLFDDVTYRIRKIATGFEIKIEDSDFASNISSGASLLDSYEDDEDLQIDASKILKLAHSYDKHCDCQNCRNQNEDTEKICSGEPDCNCGDCIPRNPTSPSHFGK
jgi:hypothetical protein